MFHKPTAYFCELDRPMNLINTKDTMVRIVITKQLKTELGKEFNLLVKGR
jgi:hypothetical protein